ncbi:MAG: tRNA (N6-threonylcarbamoyladenosine(37)-N6)-methyltransferase TrmO [Acinetobacter sp.]|jgi:tRNA-Thr(GGU) m(6)t(6)A37 methyltransferase TsaA|nr:MAG: tRNA (N6-threonylcarbamoyladenosine(37)-N6)-methyltransferase TrmO [Acinetobacter sp.]
MNDDIVVPVIGVMRSAYRGKFGIPRQPNLVSSMAYVVMQAPYDDLNAFVGLEQFSHIWLLWQFHENKRRNFSEDFQPLIRPPRLGGNQKIGVFASRSMYRPAPIGLSVVQFVEIKRVGQETRVYVKGADLLDGTPILDIKPYLAYVDAIFDAKSGYAQIAPERYAVCWSQEAEQHRDKLLIKNVISLSVLEEIEQVLALNPKPAYQQNQDKVYGLHYADVNVRFKVLQQTIEIVGIAFWE